MIRRTLLIATAALAFLMFGSFQPAHAQCVPLTLTVNGSSSATVSPGKILRVLSKT